MSHFSMLVVVDNPEQLTEVMQPFHEFECTGKADQYVQNIDVTEEVLNKYKSSSSFDDDSVIFDVGSYINWIESYHGFKPVEYNEEPDIENKHKYGFFVLDENGNVTKVVNRTNPNAKWDWFVVGGRYDEKFIDLDNNPTNIIRISDMNETAMKAQNSGYRAEYIENVFRKLQESHSLSKEEIFSIWKNYAEIVNEDKEIIPNLNKEWRSKSKEEQDVSDGYKNFIINKLGNEHPVVVAYTTGVSESFDSFLFGWQVPTEYTNLSDWVDEAPWISGYGILNDGEWISKGDMGWFGIGSNEDDELKWYAKLQEIVESLPKEKYLISVDCHI